jgi:hypothetical protein
MLLCDSPILFNQHNVVSGLYVMNPYEPTKSYTTNSGPLRALGQEQQPPMIPSSALQNPTNTKSSLPPPSTPLSSHLRYSMLLLLLLLLSLGIIRTARWLGSSDLPTDFMQYWAVGRLVLQGENPYDPALQLREQQQIYPDRDLALMMWNPPPALTLYVPLGWLPVLLAAWIWNSLQLLAVVLAVVLLVRVYAPQYPVWIFMPMAFGFAGTWWLLFYGQNTGLIVLGLAGFVWGLQRQRYWLAGSCGALTVLKPHLVLAFGVTWLADILTPQRRRAVGAGICAVVLATAVCLCSDPMVFKHFVAALTQSSPYGIRLMDWKLPTASYWLRLWWSPTAFWVQFVPSVLLALIALGWRIRQGERWQWSQTLPCLIAGSVLTTGYGGWIFDLILLLVPLVALAAKKLNQGRAMSFLYLTLWQILITWATLRWAGSLHGFWWVAPAMLLPFFLNIFSRSSKGVSR